MPIGRSGIGEPGARAPQRVGDRGDRLGLADDPPVQPLLHVHELLRLALEQPADGDPRPAPDDLGDVLRADLLLEEPGVAVRALLGVGERALELRDAAVAQLGGPLEIALALGHLDVVLGLLEALLERGDVLDGRLLGLPARRHRGGLLAQLGQLALDRVAALGAGLVLVARQRGPLDLELHDAAVELVDLDRLGVDLDAQPRRRLVDQVDRLVGQEAVGDVAVRERRRRDDRRVGDAHLVVLLVAVLEPAEDRDRVLDGGLLHEHRLEAALERGVLLDVLAVLVERGRADRPQLAAGEHRLEEVRRVDGALGGARADDRVQLVHEQDDLAAGVLDLLEHGLEALLELAAVLRAGEHRADVERDDAAVAQRLGHVAVDDALGEALDDGGLADAGLADEDGVVLRAAREDLDDAADLVVAADHRIELAQGGALGEVHAEALERPDLVLGVLVGDAVRAADVLDGREHALLRQAGGAQRLAGGRPVAGEREEQVLGRDVLVAQLAHLVLGAAQHLEQLLRGGRLLRLGERRQRGERRVHLGAHGADRHPDLAQHGGHERVLLLEQRGEEVLRRRLGVAAGVREVDRAPQRLGGLGGEAIRTHRISVVVTQV